MKRALDHGNRGGEDICADIPACKGAYILILRLRNPLRIRVGSLGVVEFDREYYAYVGSAMGPGGVRARLCRHIRGRGAKRWHIDYLREHADVAYYLYTCEGPPERVIAERCRRLLDPGPRGFGSSDDPVNPTHLFSCPISLEECLGRARKCIG